MSRTNLCLHTAAGILLLAGCAEPTPGERIDAEPAGSRWSATSEGGTYVVEVGPRDGRTVIGQFHEWTVRVTDAGGNAVYPARIGISGGMPGHGHGMPSQPQVTDYLGDGVYLVEGMQFSMAGAWVMAVGIDSSAGADRANFDFELDI